MTVSTYDSRSYDLAEVFLRETPDLNSDRNKHLLAIDIQTAIEDWITYHEGPCDGCGEARGKGDHSKCILF